jgi:hypothetical protein
VPVAQHNTDDLGAVRFVCRPHVLDCSTRRTVVNLQLITAGPVGPLFGEVAFDQLVETLLRRLRHSEDPRAEGGRIPVPVRLARQNHQNVE